MENSENVTNLEKRLVTKKENGTFENFLKMIKIRKNVNIEQKRHLKEIGKR